MPVSISVVYAKISGVYVSIFVMYAKISAVSVSISMMFFSAKMHLRSFEYLMIHLQYKYDSFTINIRYTNIPMG